MTASKIFSLSSWVRHPLLLFSFLFWITRLLTLLTAVESVSYTEELYRGTLAKEILAGLKVPLWDYRPDQYSGGPIVIAVLAAPFFKLLGPTLFSLKLIPLIFSYLTLVVTFLFLDRFFSKKAAIWGSVFFIFPAPFFAGMSFLAMGFHSESLLFSALMLFCLFAAFKEKKRRTFWVFGLGLSAGAGISFTFITGLSAASCILSLFLWRPKVLNKQGFLVLLLAFFTGLAPLLYYEATHQFRGVAFVGDVFGRQYAGNFDPFLVLKSLFQDLFLSRLSRECRGFSGRIFITERCFLRRDFS
jgi:4-amino-4-deoxy-L-arabinose transferase-like glycosyltransferase